MHPPCQLSNYLREGGCILVRGGAKGWEALIYQGKSRIWGIDTSGMIDVFGGRRASSGLKCALEDSNALLRLSKCDYLKFYFLRMMNGKTGCKGRFLGTV